MLGKCDSVYLFKKKNEKDKLRQMVGYLTANGYSRVLRNSKCFKIVFIVLFWDQIFGSIIVAPLFVKLFFYFVLILINLALCVTVCISFLDIKPAMHPLPETG